LGLLRIKQGEYFGMSTAPDIIKIRSAMASAEEYGPEAWFRIAEPRHARLCSTEVLT